MWKVIDLDVRTYWLPYLETYCEIRFQKSVDLYLCTTGLPSRFSWDYFPMLSHFAIRHPEVTKFGLVIGGKYGISIYVDKFDQGVYVLDPTLDKPISKVNSNLESFLHFLMVYKELVSGKIPQDALRILIPELLVLDPEGFGVLGDLADSWWGYYFQAVMEEILASNETDD